MENIFQTAYMRSFAEEYFGKRMKKRKFWKPMKPIWEVQLPDWARLSLFGEPKEPEYMNLFYRPPEQTCRPSNPVVVDSIPDKYWKYRTNITGKPISLGGGACGTVFKAKLNPGGEKIVVKSMNTDPMIQYLAGREALIQKYLEDTGYVPKCYGMVRENTQNPGIAMEYLKHYRPLSDLCASKKNLSKLQRLKIALQVTDAVHQFHLRHVHHNDLKLDNIMVDMRSPNEPKVKIIDFGHAGYKDCMAIEVEDGNQVSAIHMAPEVLAGHSTTAMSDVYSLGIVLTALSAIHLLIPDLYNLAKTCRSEKPTDRPRVKAVLNTIREIIE